MRHERLGREFEELRMVTVPFAFGESLMLNHALSACLESNYVPFTDGEIHNKLLSLKAKRFLRSGAVRKLLVEYDFLEDVKAAKIADITLAKEFPDLSQVPLEQLRSLRNDYRSELIRFHRELSRVAARIQSDFWSPDFEMEVRGAVAADIRPRLLQLRDDLDQLIVDKVAGAGIKIISSSVLSVGVSVSAGLPLPLLLLASAGTASMVEYLDYWRKRVKRLRNGLSFLLRIPGP